MPGGLPALGPGAVMRVLVGCEFSGVVRDAFRQRGYDAWSNDIMESTAGGPHIKGDLLGALENESWDMLIAFPPCTHLAVSGARWFPDKLREQEAALEFFGAILSAPIAHIAVENPISIASTRIRKPDQVIQPWQFGHGETKATCLWLKNLPPLRPTNVVGGREPRVHREPPGPDRWMRRSRFYTGIAEAMAAQWGDGLLFRDGPGAELEGRDDA